MGTYQSRLGDGVEQQVSETATCWVGENGRFAGTFSARHGVNDLESPQPALWTLGFGKTAAVRSFLFSEETRNDTEWPHLDEIPCDCRWSPSCREYQYRWRNHSTAFDQLPDEGMHLQVQNRQGLFSNDFIFHVIGTAAEVVESSVDRRRPR